MKVLILGPFPPPVFGVSLSNYVLKKGLEKQGHSVTFVDTAGGKKIDSEVGAWDIRKLSFIKSYLGLIKVFNAQVIYCTSGQTFFGIVKYAPFIFLSLILKKKSIVHIKGGYLKKSYDKMSPLKKRIVKTILSSYDSGIVLSKSLKYMLEPFIPSNKIFIRHNFIQDTLVIPKDDIINKKHYDNLRIIYLSNLMDEKGINELLDALEELNRCNVFFEAKIAGNVPKGDEHILNKITEMKNVQYVGVVKERAKTQLLCWGNLFALPTYYKMEGQPISIIEAMGFGNLILTTKHAGIPDICTIHNGVFVDKRSSKSIFNELKKLSETLETVKHIGLHNLQEAQQLYTEEAFVKGIIEIFENT